MYSHITKGYSVGSALGRRALRMLFGIPGVLMDAVFIAPFYTGGYAKYWQDNKMSYAAPINESGKASGVAHGLFAYPGDLLGGMLGGLVGSLVGAALYVPDGILRLAAYGYGTVANYTNKLANLIGSRELFKSLGARQQPDTYLKKAWNIAAGTLGAVIAAPLFAVAKTLEFFLPIGNRLSHAALRVGGFIGGTLGTLAALPLFPVKHTASKLVTGYRALRRSVRAASAFVYAKTNTRVDSNASTTVHSSEFKARVAQYKAKSTTQILFGKMRPQPAAAAAPAAANAVPHDPLEDPITHDRFVDPVIDRHGHTFSRAGIRTWLSNHNTCPIGREQLAEADLVPNRAIADMLARP